MVRYNDILTGLKHEKSEEEELIVELLQMNVQCAFLFFNFTKSQYYNSFV